MITADLHMHTRHSDGRHHLAELVAMALKKGLQGMAITDHDTLEVGPELIELQKTNPSLRLILGVELSCQYQGGEIHLLGYQIDPSHQPLQAYLQRFRLARQERAGRMIEKLATLGVYITEAEVQQIAAGGVVGRPHIAQALVNAGYVKNLHGAFLKYLGNAKPAYVAQERIAIEQAIAAIHAAGGLASLAHPGRTKLKPADVEPLISAGLKAIEVYHTSHTHETAKVWGDFAERHQLIQTGGSDFHGMEGEEARVGGCGLDDEHWQRFLQALSA